jgi:transcriptional regulator with XRE-family HTH domain
MKIGRIIMNLRKDKGWSQMDLATQTGLSQVMIGKYERGESMPGFDSAFKIADALGVSVLAFTGSNISNKQEIPQSLVDRMEAIQKLDDHTQAVLIDVIDTYIRDAKSRQTYSK